MKNIEEWIDRAENDDEKKFRQAIHLILLAVSRDKVLSQNLVIKGGIVLSLAYGSERYTTDLDLSALDNMEVLSKEELELKLGRQITAVVALSDYNLKLLVHSIKYMPKDPSKVKFPAYKAKIGYADSTNQNAIKRLDNKQSSKIIDLDISFNESVSVSDTENFKLTDRLNVLCYSLEQLVAEKYRSILQQVVRTRSRRQDVFDIHYLLNQEASLLYSNETKKTVLDKLIKCSERKGIEAYLNQSGMRDEEIKRLSLEDFHTLSLEIDIDIEVSPDDMYTVVQEYFESLPWNDLN
jgi:hypothetical protein|tara:strand:+ start:2710 stop:3594 length:885 start_codon:yes stop_codon:yes gene_type:complete